jgi:hypothetical protein
LFARPVLIFSDRRSGSTGGDRVRQNRDEDDRDIDRGT